MIARILYKLRHRRVLARLRPDGMPLYASDIPLPDGPGWPEVTARKYPHLLEALSTISHDRGSSARSRFRVPPHWKSTLPLFETLLADMPEAQRETFILPANDQTEGVCQRELGAEMLNTFLHDFFEGFPSTDTGWASRLIFNPEPGKDGKDEEDLPNLHLAPERHS
ncbi:hypothetical protein [Marinicauda sp. Alg238-R41]|uniref:hypothetical protein n=1 Tax=Marinicauda sp. Alg238-R41 TaxID=2993447 RepID=UPI0022E5F219|nr:hypothetical protein [Marinicauda sp. Alg238-R41]